MQTPQISNFVRSHMSRLYEHWHFRKLGAQASTNTNFAWILEKKSSSNTENWPRSIITHGISLIFNKSTPTYPQQQSQKFVSYIPTRISAIPWWFFLTKCSLENIRNRPKYTYRLINTQKVFMDRLVASNLPLLTPTGTYSLLFGIRLNLLVKDISKML
jgi:hypothetical protein